jgi:thiol-disulfide isomerase/thioredoxin
MCAIRSAARHVIQGVRRGAIALLLGLGALGGMPSPAHADIQNFVFEEPLEYAPDVVFHRSDGKTISIVDLRGKVLLLNLWATWCVPCRHEMPSLDRLQAKLGDRGLEVVAVSVDRDGIKAIAPFFASAGLQHLAVYTDPTASVARALGASGLPESFLIDRSGRVVGSLSGPADWDGPAALRLIEPILAAEYAAEKPAEAGGSPPP